MDDLTLVVVIALGIVLGFLFLLLLYYALAWIAVFWDWLSSW